MDIVDGLIILALCYAGLVGYRRGLISSIFSLLGVVLGLALGSWLATIVPVQMHGYSSTAKTLVAIALVLGLAIAGGSLGGLIGARLRFSAVRRRLGYLDSFTGSAWGLLVVLAVSWYLGLVFEQGPVGSLASQIQGSAILKSLDRGLPKGPTWVGDLQHLLAAVPFPEVFATLVPPLPGPVQLPADLNGYPGVAAAAAETVKVVSIGCGGTIEGSAFPVAPDLLLTNAHVVAGTHETTVVVPGRTFGLRAEVVFFDPKTDLAMLQVAGLNMKPLQFASGGERGEKGAIIGYPGGGNEQVVGAAVRGELLAVGRDIYSNALVSREIYVLQGTVIPGNSGGPVVDLQGQVLGVVFAKSLVESDEGYALTSGAVQPDIDKGESDTAQVSPQDCVQ
jgi:S1-C subfamily serine protease